MEVTLLDMDPSVKAPARLADAALRTRLIGGDGTALAQIYDVHASVVYRLALRVVRDVSAAEDVTQEVFVALWKQPERFDPARGGLRTYLSTIAHRRSVDLVRSSEARRARESRVNSRKPSQPSVEDRVLARVEGQAARSSLAHLPMEQRECLELAYLRGLSFRQVAAQLKIPEGTAKSRIRLGLKRLQAIMRTQADPGSFNQGDLQS